MNSTEVISSQRSQWTGAPTLFEQAYSKVNLLDPQIRPTSVGPRAICGMQFLAGRSRTRIKSQTTWT